MGYGYNYYFLVHQMSTAQARTSWGGSWDPAYTDCDMITAQMKQVQIAAKTILFGDNGYQATWMRSERTYPGVGVQSGGVGISGYHLAMIRMGGYMWPWCTVPGGTSGPLSVTLPRDDALPYPPEVRQRMFYPSSNGTATPPQPVGAGATTASSGARSEQPEPRHDGQANFVFVDGHAASMSEQEIVQSWPGLWSLSKSASQFGR
ncbi:MAG: hypothetical protein FJ279_29870 [Planctomycetes bacterium]|nr:hypothetical protein [Planctomycetota bacterium]